MNALAFAFIRAGPPPRPSGSQSTPRIPAHAVSPLLHGVFFEDITTAPDGGTIRRVVQTVRSNTRASVRLGTGNRERRER